MNRRTASWASLAIALACAGVVQSQDTQPAEAVAETVAETAAEASAEPAVIAEVAEAEPRKPLMLLMDKAGAGATMDEYGLNLSGWIEASITWGVLRSPDDDTLEGRAFDFEHNDPTLNQIGLAFSREVDTAKPWDIGFSIETLYGADGRFTASNGMDFQTGTSPNNQFDITQACIDIVIPVGNGLKTRVGKFITPIGYEYTNNTLNPNFSHSYLFGIIPFSHTGVYFTYAFDDTKTLSLGVARGWEQSLEDNNDALEVVWSWTHQCSDRFFYAFNGSVGPQQDDNNGNYRTMLDYWSDFEVNDQLTIGINADYRYDSSNGQNGDASHVWGIAGYFKFTVNDYLSINPRLEYFNDTSRVDGFDSILYAATLGATITPFPNDQVGSNLKIRPEIRYDYSKEDLFDGGDEKDLMTVALSAFFTF